MKDWMGSIFLATGIRKKPLLLLSFLLKLQQGQERAKFSLLVPQFNGSLTREKL